MSGKEKRRALGRGLGALLPGAPTPGAPRSDAEATSSRRTYFIAQIEDIHPNPEQPRRRFADDALEELAQSIRAHGIIQPLIVKARSESGYELIAGERRWRAAQRAALTEVPIVVQDVSARDAFERALVENLQRQDLNAIEEAIAYQRLIDNHAYTQEEVAERVGKDRSTIANSLRLLKLPDSVKQMVEDETLSMGHARALLALERPSQIETLAAQVSKAGLSVRATEALVKQTLAPPSTKPEKPPKSASVRDLESRLTKSLGSQVQVTESKRGKGGSIEIRYADLDDLDRLLERLLRR